MTDLAGRIKAVLAAACLGDALGAATEGMQRDEIVAVFGGPVSRLLPAPERAPFARGMEPGRLTDDATQMLAMADVLVRSGGRPTVGDAEAGLIAWADDEETFQRFAGPTTRLAIERIRQGRASDPTSEPYSCIYGASNGAAMRAPVAGAANPGGVADSVRVAAILSIPTHATQVALAGAGAVAATVAAGLAGRRTGDIGSSALEGARLGEAEGRLLGRIVGGASVLRRLEVALGIAARYRGDPDGAMIALEAEVGNGVAMAEAVPTAVGLAVAADGNPLAAILAAVNGGNDSDTIAMMAGAVAAAWADATWIPGDLLAEVELVNHIDLAGTSRALAALTEIRGGEA
jgi:ADP-ribosylglycohydrolase